MFRSASIYVSDVNHNNVDGSSQYDSSLKRSVKDMNDEKKQENNDDLPKPKKSAASISSYFLKSIFFFF
jgi:hypothetical protein